MRLPHHSRTALCMFAGYGLLTFDESFAQGRLADFASSKNGIRPLFID